MNQHWLSEDFKHRRRHETHEVSFWMNNVACDESTATHAVVEVKNEIYVNQLEFKWPEERSKLADVERMFDRIFDKGKAAMRREFRAMLGAAPSP